MRVNRREYLATATATVAGLAGCLTGGPTGETVDSLPTPVLGESDADVTVAVFEDFACPHCATFSLNVFPQIRSEFVDSGDVRYEHHDYPIPVDSTWSWQAASAARAVQDTVDTAAFFDYAHALFENQANYSLDLIGSLASDVGADSETIRKAARNQTYRPVLETDRELGNEMNLRGTPQVYVDGEATADYSFSTVKAAIESKL